MRRLGLTLAGVLLAIAAHAVTVVYSCGPVGAASNAGTAGNGPKAPAQSLVIVTSATAAANNANGTCQLASATPAAFYTRVSTNGGTSYAWATLASLGLGQAPVALKTAPITIQWSPVTLATDGSPLTVPVTYSIYRGPSAVLGRGLTGVTILTPATSPYTDVVPYGTYYYGISASTSSGESSVSGSIMATAAAPSSTIPAKPATPSIVPAK